MKKIKFLLLILIGISYSNMMFAYDVVVNHVYYDVNLKNRTVTVTQGDTEYSGHVTIPDMIIFKGREFLVTAIGKDAFRNCDDLTSVKIGNCVDSIWDYAFFNCQKLGTVKMGPKIKSIGACAFQQCYSLSEINIPNEVISIKGSAFENCNNLKSVTLGKSVKEIGSGAFYSCDKLSSITLPHSLKKVESHAFSYCPALRDVRIEDSEEALTLYGTPFSSSGVTTLYLGRNLTIEYNDYGPFYSLEDLKDVEIGNLVTSIPNEAFYSCKALNSVVLSENLTEIGTSAFQMCENLNTVTIPAKVKTIKGSAFFGCKNLSSIYSQALLPPSNDNEKECFDDRTYLNATLHVADTRKSAYSNAPLWRNFFTIVEPGDEYFDNMSILNIEANEGGSVRFNDIEIKNQTIYHEFSKNEKVLFSFQPNDGWRLKTLIVNGEDVTEDINNDTYAIQMKEDYTIIVKFEKVPIYLTIQHAENGSISQLAEINRAYHLLINPSENWKINTVSFNGKDVTANVGADHSYTTPEITENATLNISFELDSASAIETAENANISVRGYNGSIFIDGAVYGDVITVFTVDGCEIQHDIASGSPQSIRVQANQVYIVKVNNRVFKVSL